MNTPIFSNKIGGEYQLVVTRPDGTMRSTGWFNNIITNTGFDRMMASQNTMTIGYASVGSGTSTPIGTQTALDNKIGATSAVWSALAGASAGSPTYAASHTFTCVFTQGSVIGNITEVGVGWLSSGVGSLFSRALILDGVGAPTTLSLTAVDQLTVYYRVTVTPTVTDTTGTVTISGTPVNYTIRLGNAGSFSGFSSYSPGNGQSGAFSGNYLFPPYGNIYTYGGTVSLPALTASNMTATTSLYEQPTLATAAYVPGTFYTDNTWTWGPTKANHTGGSLSGITLVWGLNGHVFYHILFATPILKTNTKTFTLNTRLAWTR